MTGKPARCPNPECGNSNAYLKTIKLPSDWAPPIYTVLCPGCGMSAGEHGAPGNALAAWAKMGAWREPKAEPRVDYFYDPRFDEISTHWDDRYDYMIDRDYDEVIEVTAVVEVGTKWLARVVLSWDDDNEPDDWDVLAFDSEAEAKAAVLANKPPKEEP